MDTFIQTADVWFQCLLLLSLKGTALALAAGLLLLVLRRWISAAWRHALWLLVLLRFAVPDLGSSPLALARWTAPPAEVAAAWPEELPTAAPVQMDELPQLPVSQVWPDVEAQPVTPALSRGELLVMIWLAGAATLLLVMAALHLRMLLRLRRDRREPNGGATVPPVCRRSRCRCETCAKTGRQRRGKGACVVRTLPPGHSAADGVRGIRRSFLDAAGAVT